MPHFSKAEDRENEFYFEVCPRLAQEGCQKSDVPRHRVYRWKKNKDAEGKLIMPSARCINEIKLLEALLVAEPRTLQTLAVSGTDL